MSKKVIALLSLLPLVAIGAELDHTFNSPSFSGIGYSSHVLTIQQLETQQKDKNKAAADALAAQAKADAANTPQAQFQANVQSRIYSQLAKQITDTLFGANGGPSCSGSSSSCGGTMDIGGNNITWGLSADGKMINIKVVNDLDPSQFTKMSVPVGTFGF
jgi:hypothetical protein